MVWYLDWAQTNAQNKFYWVDGTPLSGQYSKWGSGEPTNTNEDCGLFWGPRGPHPNSWDNAYCDFSVRVQQGKPVPLALCQKAAESK